MTPRDPFATLSEPEPDVPAEPVVAIPAVLRRKPSQAQRPRVNQADVVTYRGVPPDLQREVREIAQEIGVPIGDVVHFMLGDGVQRYRAGTLVLIPQLKVGKMTLFPAGERK